MMDIEMDAANVDNSIKQIKDVFYAMLGVDIKYHKDDIHKMFPKHPFICNYIYTKSVSGTYEYWNITDPDDLQKVKAYYREMIDKENDFHHLMQLVAGPYRAQILNFCSSYLSDEVLANELSYTWISTEFFGNGACVSASDWISMFKRSDKQHLMDNEEQEVFNNFPDEIEIYRGVGSKGKVRGMSWTVSRDVAEWFANRYNQNGNVYSAKIKKEHVLAYFVGRGEQEVIVEPRFLKNVSALLI